MLSNNINFNSKHDIINNNIMYNFHRMSMHVVIVESLKTSLVLNCFWMIYK